ncbi:hypothetical protein RB195_004210 [Necator americanus]|uniref:Uncharacterized protein n=1 Tax=Necator americanus TaxID=51031 RepID=A0ABR1BGV9_NECAM
MERDLSPINSNINPRHPELALPVLEGEHVTISMGTGLVHTSFAHGFTDYEITDGSLRQKALGADGLRLWVALSAGETVGESKIGEKVLADLELKVWYPIKHTFFPSPDPFAEIVH